MSPRTTSMRRGLVAAGAALMLVAGGAANAATFPASPEAPDAQPNPDAPVLPNPTQVERISGADRYATAAEIARNYPAGTTGTVIIASGQNFPDALSSQLAASVTGAELNAERFAGSPVPILLTRTDSLPGATASALRDLAPSKIVIVGGEGAVSETVATQLQGYAATVQRISGANRYDTSAAVAATYPAGAPVVYVATGADYPDALAAGARAGRDGVPVLLTRSDRLDGATASALEHLAPESVVVIGGSGAVSQEVVDAITEMVPDTTRVSGADRYATAAALAEAYEPDNVGYLASGTNFPDALTGGAFAGIHRGPLLLTRPHRLPGATLNAFDRLSPQGIVLFGGTVAVNQAVVTHLHEPENLPLWVDELVVQMLSFNDFHGRIAVDPGARLNATQDPDQNPVGGAVNFSATLKQLRSGSFDSQTLTVAAGDLIGGSTFLSGMFQDEPSIEVMNTAGLQVSSVGNHEFDEGVDELLRIVEGGNHPELGQFGDEPYAGTDFAYLAANVVYKDDQEPILPVTWTTTVDGVDIGFIGVTLEDTPTLVSPAGIQTVDFLPEVETINRYAAELQQQGVETIVALVHEGGQQTGTYRDCTNLTGPIVGIAENLDPAVDAIVSGHTHQPYVCSINDPAGNPRTLTSANQYGRVISETTLSISRSTGDVMRHRVNADNHLVLQSIADDPEMVPVVEKWEARAEVMAGRVVGTVAEDITGDASGNRGIETPMANLVADAILAGTSADDAGAAQISFMNVGGVRASLLVDQITNEEEPGEVTYEEAYNVLPFGNILVTVDMTGADVKEVLEQQYISSRGRPMLALGVSEGFTYTWDADAPEGEKVSNMQLNGVALEMDATYKVSTLNFLQEGGDMFTAFRNGTNLVGGPEDLAAFVSYLQANPGLTAPEDRVEGL
ncbi:cell wall-binding repeat-containing protein [Ornithinimicrobium sp. Y1694]|uniref:cell wall-binding repeat-containing protein n=1 Tax=Ornithinimicrobium sp. Y1694 TaxID=3418590 RepID=UPI003CE8FF42